MRLIIFVFFSIYTQILFCEEFQTIEVKPGQTLWELSQIYLKNPQRWDEIIKYNNLPADPYQPLDGRKLKVPVNLIKEEYRAARFRRVSGEVRVRSEGKSIWVDAEKIKDLFKGDTIRTNANSYADVEFYTKQILNIFANSMVVLKPPADDKFDVKMLSGQLMAKDTSIITVSAKITPKTKNTEVAAKIKEDLSTVVQVYKGKADVEAKGKKVELQEGFATEVKINSTPSLPKKIPDIIADQKMARLDLDASSGIVSVKYVGVQNANVKAGDANIEIKDQAKAKNLKIDQNVNIDLSKAVSGYRLQIAKDKEFNNIIFDRKFDVFKQLNLENYVGKGKYYFRISYIDLIGFEGEFTQPKEVVVE
ncbi:MAG: hypothetical protein K6357_05600 [Elusimicrobiota bacterium]